MFHLCIDARMIDAAGIGSYLQAMIHQLDKSYHLSLLGDVKRLKMLLSRKNISYLPCKAPIYSLQEQWQLSLLIPKCDLFWSPHFNTPYLPIKAKKRLVTIHDMYHMVYAKTLKWHVRHYARFLLTNAARAADDILTDSEFSKEQIEKYLSVDQKKVKVLPSIIDKQFWAKVTDESVLKQVKNKYGLSDQFILTVGSIKAHKNLKKLVTAMKLLWEEGSSLPLVIVGKKEGMLSFDKELFELISKQKEWGNKIIFTGYVQTQELPVLYSLAKVFVFPSLYEGFGLPPLEAMACGCPVVVSNAASLPEVCKDGAFFVNPLNEADIASGINKILKDSSLQDFFVEKGYYVSSLYAPEHIEPLLKKIIDDLLVS